MPENAAEWTDDYDFVIVHDPQPAAMLAMLEERGPPQGEVGVAVPHRPVELVRSPCGTTTRSGCRGTTRAVFTMQDFVRPGFEGPEVFIIPPSIDPLSTKNCWIGPGRPPTRS